MIVSLRCSRKQRKYLFPPRAITTEKLSFLPLLFCNIHYWKPTNLHLLDWVSLYWDLHHGISLIKLKFIVTTRHQWSNQSECGSEINISLFSNQVSSVLWLMSTFWVPWGHQVEAETQWLRDYYDTLASLHSQQWRMPVCSRFSELSWTFGSVRLFPCF